MSYVNNLPYFPPPPGQSGAPPPLPPRNKASPHASSHAGCDNAPGSGPYGQYGALDQPTQYGQANQYRPIQNSNGGNYFGTETPPLPRRPAQSSNYNQHQPTLQGTVVREQQIVSSSEPQLVQECSHTGPTLLYAQSQVPLNYQYHPGPSNTSQGHTTSQVQSHYINQPVLTEGNRQQQQQVSYGEIQPRYRPETSASYSTEQWLPAPHLLGANQQVQSAATIFSSTGRPFETKPPEWNRSHYAGEYVPQPISMQSGNVYRHQDRVQLPSDAHRFPPASDQVSVPAPSYMVADTNPIAQYTSHVSTVPDHEALQSMDDRDWLELQRPEVQAILRQRQIELESYQRQNQTEVRQQTSYSQQSQGVQTAAYTATVARQQLNTIEPHSQASRESTQVGQPVYNPATYIVPPQPKPDTEDVYHLLDAGRVVRGQREQQVAASLPPQHDIPQIIDGQASGGKPNSQNSRTSKWMNKLDNLSAGLSKLQLQLASPLEQPAAATPAARLKPYSPQQIASAVSEPIGAHQPAPQHHASVIHALNNTSETVAVPSPLDSSRNAQNELKHSITKPQGQQPEQNPEPEAWTRSVPRMTIDGPPNSITFDCPETRVLDYKATWYYLAAVPDFLVCTRCHEQYLSDSPVLSSKFLTVTLTGKEEHGETHGVRRGGNMCRFNVPRLTRVLIPHARETGDLAAVEDFMRHRLTLKDCPGTNAVKSNDDVKWYGVTSMRTTTGVQLPDIWQWVVVCEACHEDRVLGTRFASKFQPLERTQPADQEWKCDLGASSFLLRSLLHYSHQATLTQDISNHTANNSEEDWLSLTTTTSPYWSLPACSGPRNPIEPATRTWYRANSLPSLIYCEKCYLDKIQHTAFQNHFSQLAVTSKTGSSWMDFALGYTTVETPLYTCAAGSRPMLIALEYTLARRDMATFLSVAETILGSPVCTDQGLEDEKLNKLTGGKWYRFASGVSRDKFRICEACHACLVTAAGIDGYFEVEPLEVAEGKRLVCSLHTGAPRGREFLLRYQEAVDVGVWERFEGHVKVWVEIPPCPRYRHDAAGEGLRWFGWMDCLICRECWVLFCQPAMEKMCVTLSEGDQGSRERGRRIVDVEGGLDIPVRDELIADARMCCMYSPRMRGLFLAVLEEKSQMATVPSPTAEEALITHARHRHAVYAATIPQVRMIQQMREMQMLSSLNSGMVGLMYQGAGAMQNISGNTDGYLHGNGSLGWHETENHATSAAFFDKSRAEGAAVVGGTGADMMRVMMLMKEWETVE